MNDKWDEQDAVNVLALPLHRWESREWYAEAGGYRAELRRLAYSNGTEHVFASERAKLVLDLGPMLRRVLIEGVRALRNDWAFDRYISAFYAGDRDEIVRLEAAS